MDTIAFIGGGNMARALIGGLRSDGWAGDAIVVVEPDDVARVRLAELHRVRTLAAADATLAEATLVVWAVKPQSFAAAAAPCVPRLGAEALHLSVMAGIRSGAIARMVGSERVVRAMPNTPALIGEGIAGLYAREAVSGGERELVEEVMTPTGRLLWVASEPELDAVTALSGSGPAYVFYFLEAMMQAAAEMGLGAEAGKQLALATFAGATELALRASEQPHALRAQVTSRGGTTQAAIDSMEADGVKTAIVKALHAAQARAVELGDALGG